MNNICVTALLMGVLTACGTPASTASAPVTENTYVAGSASRDSVAPNNCQLSIFLIPRSATIHLNQEQLLSVYEHFPWQNLCYTGPAVASWAASGGTLKVINSGKQADFSASKTGSYTITASKFVNFHRLQATASISVEP